MKLSLERIMDRVKLVFDCDTDEESQEIYNLLASQVLDGRAIHIRIITEEKVQ